VQDIDLVIKLISTQDVRKWDNSALLLWAMDMAKLIEEKTPSKHIETGQYERIDSLADIRYLYTNQDGIKFYLKIVE
jgi:hypothetical protein